MTFEKTDPQIKVINELTLDPRIVIAGGGNFSVKDGNLMIIKASGSFMPNMSRGNMAVVKRDTLEQAIDHHYSKIPNDREAEYKDFLIRSKVDPQAGRPSVETAVHHLMNGKYVLHTHATVLTSLTSKIGLNAIAPRLLGDDYIIMDFLDPGILLGKEAKRLFAEYGPKQKLVQRNHGIFYTADSIGELIDMHNKDVEAVGDFFKKNIARDDYSVKPFGEPVEQFGNDHGKIDYREIMKAIYRGTFGEEPQNPKFTDEKIEDNLHAIKMETKKGVVYFSTEGLAQQYAESSLAQRDAGRFSWLTPDHIVYMGKHNDYIHINEPLKADRTIEEVASQIKRYEADLCSRVFVIGGVGIATVAGHHPKDDRIEPIARYAMQGTNDALLVYQATGASGGWNFLTPANADFIHNWEVEDARRITAQKQRS